MKNNILGERIRDRRRELRMSQEELAEKCGYKHKVSISSMELGKQVPPLPKLEIIAKQLYTTVAYLRGEEDYENGLSKEEVQYLEMLHKDPAYKVLLDSTKKLNRASLEKLISFIDTLSEE